MEDLHAMAVGLESVQQWLVGDGLRILAVLVLALLAQWALKRAISRVVATVTERNRRKDDDRPHRSTSARVLEETIGFGHERQTQRVSTLGSLLNSIVTFVVWLVAVLTVMAILGLPLGPVLASAGVGGVALGFGAQSLVRDFLSGVFMIFEDQYGVGDVIDVGPVTGTVEEVGLRVTRIRDGDGVVWYVRNGEIIRVANHSQGWSTATVDTTVGYTENTERVIAVIEAAAQPVATDPIWADRLLEEPRTVGVESIAGTSQTIRTVARCAPNEHAAVQRELRRRIKDALDAAGVEPPAEGD